LWTTCSGEEPKAIGASVVGGREGVGGGGSFCFLHIAAVIFDRRSCSCGDGAARQSTSWAAA